MKYMYSLVGLIIILIVGVVVFLQFGNSEETSQNQENSVKLESILTEIEIADSNKERQQGLQNRESLCETCGMLFIFDREEPVSFWMKNTSISLDMIFINNDGEIKKIHKNTTPFRLSPTYMSESKVRYVVEVNAGFTDTYSIKEGDLVDIDTLISNGQPFDESSFDSSN